MSRVVVVGQGQAAPAPGDVVLDLDALRAALGGDAPHIRHVALRALRAAREAAARLHEDVVVWDVRAPATHSSAHSAGSTHETHETHATP